MGLFNQSHHSNRTCPTQSLTQSEWNELSPLANLTQIHFRRNGTLCRKHHLLRVQSNSLWKLCSPCLPDHSTSYGHACNTSEQAQRAAQVRYPSAHLRLLPSVEADNCKDHENLPLDSLLWHLVISPGLLPYSQCVHRALAGFCASYRIGVVLPPIVRVCVTKPGAAGRLFRCSGSPCPQGQDEEGQWLRRLQSQLYQFRDKKKFMR